MEKGGGHLHAGVYPLYRKMVKKWSKIPLALLPSTCPKTEFLSEIQFRFEQ